MTDTCPGFSPKADVAFDADCKHCGEKHAAHDTCAYVPNDRASGGPCNHCQACGAPRAEHANYRVGDLLTLKSGAQWRVATLYPSDDGRAGVGLVDPLNPNHGTAFYADVLDTLVVAEPFTESGDYPAGTDFVVSAHVVDTDGRGERPMVSVSSARVARTFLHLTTASAREVATALLIAADHADRDATADEAPKVTVHADATGTFTIPKAGVWEFRTDRPITERIASLYAGESDTARCREWLGLDDKHVYGPGEQIKDTGITY